MPAKTTTQTLPGADVVLCTAAHGNTLMRYHNKELPSAVLSVLMKFAENANERRTLRGRNPIDFFGDEILGNLQNPEFLPDLLKVWVINNIHREEGAKRIESKSLHNLYIESEHDILFNATSQRLLKTILADPKAKERFFDLIERGDANSAEILKEERKHKGAEGFIQLANNDKAWAWAEEVFATDAERGKTSDGLSKSDLHIATKEAGVFIEISKHEEAQVWARSLLEASSGRDTWAEKAILESLLLSDDRGNSKLVQVVEDKPSKALADKLLATSSVDPASLLRSPQGLAKIAAEPIAAEWLEKVITDNEPGLYAGCACNEADEFLNFCKPENAGLRKWIEPLLEDASENIARYDKAKAIFDNPAAKKFAVALVATHGIDNRSYIIECADDVIAIANSKKAKAWVGALLKDTYPGDIQVVTAGKELAQIVEDDKTKAFFDKLIAHEKSSKDQGSVMFHAEELLAFAQASPDLTDYALELIRAERISIYDLSQDASIVQQLKDSQDAGVEDGATGTPPEDIVEQLGAHFGIEGRPQPEVAKQ